MSRITITVNNWDKYNPKRKQGTYTWLRLNNDIAYDHKLFSLNPGQKYLWILILCQCSRDNSGTATFKLQHLQQMSGVSLEDIKSALEELTAEGVISTRVSTTALHQTTPDYTALHQTTPTNERTNERDERTREHARASERVIDSAEKLKASLPILTRERMQHLYPDEAWREREIESCFLFHSADQTTYPRSSGAWAKKLQTWLAIGWAKARPENAREAVSDADYEKIFGEKRR